MLRVVFSPDPAASYTLNILLDSNNWANGGPVIDQLPCLMSAACMACDEDTSAMNPCQSMGNDYDIFPAIAGNLYGTKLRYTCPLAWAFENPADPSVAAALPEMIMEVNWEGEWTPHQEPGTCISNGTLA